LSVVHVDSELASSEVLTVVRVMPSQVLGIGNLFKGLDPNLSWHTS